MFNYTSLLTIQLPYNKNQSTKIQRIAKPCSDMEYQYYVEILTRIKCISIVLDIKREDKVELRKCSQPSNTLLELFLYGEKESISIPLPYAIAIIPNLQSCVKVNGVSINIRLPFEEVSQNSHMCRSSNFLMSMSQNYKWTASFLSKELKGDYTVECKACNNNLIESYDVSQVKVMPSEMWSEMLDFWHCHKPDSKDDTSLTEKFSKLKPYKNSLLIGSYYFAIGPDDDIAKINRKDFILSCPQCHKDIGIFDDNVGINKIYKWAVLLTQKDKIMEYEPYQYIFDMILDHVNSDATRLLEIRNQKETKSLLLWVFSIGIEFFVKDEPLQSNAIKLFYTTDKEKILQEKKSRGEIELIEVDEIVINSTLIELESSNRKLPESIRSMSKDLKLGILRST